MSIDVDAVLASLTLEQKISLLAGHDNWHTVPLPGVPQLRCSDGPAGVRGTRWNGPASASFPCGTALGATFDPGLVEEVGTALGREARSKGAHVLLAPTVNLHRTPIGGRNFECMSEDPLLTAEIAAAYVRGVQSHRVACCIKHFVGNDTEHERHTISSEIDDVTLREAYLVPFERAVAPIEQGGADVRALMTSYNRLNGTYASEHPALLRGVLHDEWGFDGVTYSDWYGTHTAGESLEAGLDLEMPGPPRERGAALELAVSEGRTTEARVDESVRRLLELMNWTGADETTGEERTDDAPETRAVIHRAAIAGTVLLKNDGVLPLGADPGTIALLGPNSERGRIQGGGSAHVRVNQTSLPAAVLAARGVSFVHESGCRIEKRLRAMRGEFVVAYAGLDGATAEAPTDRINFTWMDDPAPGISKDAFGATVTGTFVPDATGDWEIGFAAVGSAVLRIDGEIVVDLTVPQTGGSYFGLGSDEIRAVVPCEEGVARHVDVTVAVEERAQLRGLRVGAEPPSNDDEMARAVAAAAAAHTAVVVVGTTSDWETEGEDRTTMGLPGRQDELIHRVAAVNARTVVVINAGSPVTMPWADEVAAVMQVWFPGEEMGAALVDVLLGTAEPGGRLPTTIPMELADTPAFDHHPGRDGVTRYAEGLLIGYRWYDAKNIEPRFAFGHGLGYTSWELGAPTLEGSIDNGVTVSVPVRNSGDRDGSTIVQVYAEGPAGPTERPLRTLCGFAKVTAPAGGSTVATVTVPSRGFSRWDAAAGGWVIDAGEHALRVGLSSRELSSPLACRAPAPA